MYGTVEGDVWRSLFKCYHCLIPTITSFTHLVWSKLYLLLTHAESKWNSSSAHWTLCDECWPDDSPPWKPLLQWKMMPKCKLVRAHHGYRGTHHLFLHGHECPACAKCEATACSWMQSVACQATDRKVKRPIAAPDGTFPLLEKMVSRHTPDLRHNDSRL